MTADHLSRFSDTRWIDAINNDPANQDPILCDIKVGYKTDSGFVTELNGTTQRLAAALKHPGFKKEMIDAITIDTVHWPHDLIEQPALSAIKSLTFSEREKDQRYRWADSAWDYENSRLVMIKDIIESPHLRSLETLRDNDCGKYWPVAKLVAKSTNLVNLRSLEFREPDHTEKFITAYEKALQASMDSTQPMPLPKLERVNGISLPESIINLRERVSAQALEGDASKKNWVQDLKEPRVVRDR